MENIQGKRQRLTNGEKLNIIQRYLDEGHLYAEIRQRTRDKRGFPIGRWISSWRTGHVQLSYREREKLIKMGETFQSRFISNKGKIVIIWSYLQEGHLYEEIVQSTKDKYGHPIGQWIDSWRNDVIKLTEEERRSLSFMGETFEPRHIPNSEKIKIIQNHLKQGNFYSEITKNLKDGEGHPIGRWVDNWRRGTVKMTEEERQILILMGETFQPKRKKIECYPISIEIQNPFLTRQDIMVCEKVKSI